MYYDTGSKDTDSGSELFLFIVTTIVQHLHQLRFHLEFPNAISSGGERAQAFPPQVQVPEQEHELPQVQLPLRQTSYVDLS